jgi:class 3 adenylate cyclase
LHSKTFRSRAARRAHWGIPGAKAATRSRVGLHRRVAVEKGKTEALLLNILPGTIVSRIREGDIAIADSFPDATILFADLVDFTALAGKCSPARIVDLLNTLFSAFDALAK